MIRASLLMGSEHYPFVASDIRLDCAHNVVLRIMADGSCLWWYILSKGTSVDFLMHMHR